MDELFNESIAPAVDRTASGIDALKSRNLMTCLGQSFTLKWNIGPNQTPTHQTLGKIDEDSGYDILPRTSVEEHFIEVNQQDNLQDAQSE